MLSGCLGVKILAPVSRTLKKWGLCKPRVLHFPSPSPLCVACILSSSLGITTPPCAYFVVIRQEGIFYLLPWKYPLSVNGCNTACTLVPPFSLFVFACEFCINCTILSLERKNAWCHPLGRVCVCTYCWVFN